MYYLKHPELGEMETEFWAMADRKVSQGWELTTPFKKEEKLEDEVTIIKKRGRPKKEL